MTTAGVARPPASTTVLARPAISSPVRRIWFRENVWNSLWFVPVVATASVFVLARITVEIDAAADAPTPPRLLFPGGAEVVASVSGTIAAAMLTFLAIVFSTTLVAVQLASSQYSPRIVRVFVRSRVTQVTLAMFMSTFVVALEVLVSARDTGASSPALTATLLYALMLATIITFVIFLHRIVRLLRVQYLLLWVSRGARDVLEQEFPPLTEYREVPRPADANTRDFEYRGRPGVVQAVDTGGLCRVAAQNGCWIEMLVTTGEHVGRHTRVARVHGECDLDETQLSRRLLVGGERTLVQDPGFGIRQLVDTASRALSPAVNDPTTALQALQRVVDLLLRVATRPDPTGWYTDGTGAARLRVRATSFERLALLGFTEILRYGADSPQITRALRAAYDDLEAVAPERAATIAALRAQWDDALRASGLPVFDAIAREPDRMGLG